MLTDQLFLNCKQLDQVLKDLLFIRLREKGALEAKVVPVRVEVKTKGVS